MFHIEVTERNFNFDIFKIKGKHGPLGGDALLKHEPIYWDSGSLILHAD